LRTPAGAVPGIDPGERAVAGGLDYGLRGVALVGRRVVEIGCSAGDESRRDWLGEVGGEIVDSDREAPGKQGMRIRCTLDAAWRTTSGSHDVEEYKTIAALPQSTEFLSLNFQRQAYHYAAVQKYGPGGQVLYMFQRREVPPGFGSRPLRMNKNGSVAKNNASQNRDDYMQQVAVPKSPEAIARFERNVREKKAAVKMYRASGVWPRVPIMSGNESCDKCPYFKLCDAEANGSSLSADALHAEYYHSPVAGRDQGAFAA
jgi:hypothetical protein